MSEIPEMSVEFGAGSASSYRGRFDDRYVSSLTRDLDELSEIYDGEIGIDWIPYDGLDDNFSLVSPDDNRHGLTLDQARTAIDGFNSHGLRFNLAINGGYDHSTRNGETPVDLRDETLKTVYAALSHSAEQGAKYGVKNMVTIYLDGLRRAIAEVFPDVFTTIASCTKFTGGWAGQHQGLAEIGRACKDYDRVVLLPQHTFRDVIDPVGDYADKLVIFPYSQCARKDLYRCFAHHRAFDITNGVPRGRPVFADCRGCLQIQPSIVPDWMPQRKDFAATPVSSMLLQAGLGGRCDRPTVPVEDMLSYLERIMRTYGLQHFKLPRDNPLDPPDLLGIANLFAKARGRRHLDLEFTYRKPS